MRIYLLLLLWAIVLLFGCSKEDEASNCDSCIIQTQKVKFCDNGDGTYLISSAGESLKYTSQEIEDLGLTFEEYMKSCCISGKIQ
ncbi:MULTISPECIES: hypothetical protein [Flavobacteriaceae]|uniref:hypothetical protein n=1 Tax=Flavobacteriaceae TaxID=49546 RepID=UPI001491CC69|nr:MULTISPECIES: hypothetical protein [Allomuricauda]MDC6365189.1 hypothetical protein [Muricauda sp. AC10]